ncbi:GLPGLI family protein [Fulvivirga maritima]|uniref:GLPGLI family protein n=1 Tax=Fulvivirga maritima TaxID=2904247 RepID=UPI001F1D37F4|nr:GLPGLI family protein [Fulvivirga maritima]UII25059.1 GLPGLI family protein [Fulvivirga maritima]
MNSYKILFSFFLLVLVTAPLIAQNTNCGKVIYNETQSFSYGTFNTTYEMTFGTKGSYTEEIEINKSSDQKHKAYDNSGEYTSGTMTIVSGRKNLTPKFYYNSKDHLYFREIWYNHVLVVIDRDSLWNWELLPESKNIGNFLCQKATAHFRGRDYTAWFTTKIPVPYGPWKAYGLPGLIMEIYDADKLLYIVAQHVNLNSTTNNCKLTVPNDLDQALIIENYLNERDRLTEENFAKLAARYTPKGATPMKIDRNCESCKNENIERYDLENTQ